MSRDETLQWLEPDWPAPAGVRAAATLRAGGVSVGPYASLNLGAHVGDDPRAVAENRRRVRHALGLPAEPMWLNQVHGVNVHGIDAVTPAKAGVHPRVSDAPPARARGSSGGARAALRMDSRLRGNDGNEVVDRVAVVRPPTADACVAFESGQICVVLTADCLPVLFCDLDGTRVAAAHAGWRGLAGGVLEATVSALQTEPGRLMAWLGPAIEQDAFEVGSEVREQFIGRDPACAAAFFQNPHGRWQADIYALARRELERLGLREIHGGGFRCHEDRERFFSYRRDGVTGRMGALAWLEK